MIATHDEGICIMMFDPIPSKPNDGNRHARTRTYFRKNLNPKLLEETPRQALLRDIEDVRNIYREDGLLNDMVEKALMEVYQRNVNEPKFKGVYNQ
jgi:hypothetical protein